LRRIGAGPDRQRIVDGLRALDTGAANLDIKALEGRPQWRRLRIGDFRVLYRPTDEAMRVERIVNRRDLDKAIDTL
jgi:mRNA-degrading endonuclease RelE of RelBE toxin-antitoxin system